MSILPPMWDEFRNVCLPDDLPDNDLKYYKMLFMSGAQSVVLALAHKADTVEGANETFKQIAVELESYFRWDVERMKKADH
jgi:hypothetical protein